MSAPVRPTDAGEINVARVVGVHGVRGAVRVLLHDRDSTALREGLEISLRDRSGVEVKRGRLDRVAPKPGSALVRLWIDGVQSREAADALREAEVWVSREELPALAEDEFYLADTVGKKVLEQGRELGTIAGITHNGAQDLFEIEWTDQAGKHRQWLLPVLPQFVVSIDDDAVHVDVPPGMLPTALEGGGPE